MDEFLLKQLAKEGLRARQMKQRRTEFHLHETQRRLEEMTEQNNKAIASLGNPLEEEAENKRRWLESRRDCRGCRQAADQSSPQLVRAY